MNGFEWNFDDLNWLAIVAATASMMVISSVWYMKPVFGKMWMEDVGMTDEKMKANATPALFIGVILTGFVSAVAMALLIENIGGGVAEGLLVGAVVGIAIAAMAETPHYRFAGQPMRLMLINISQTAATLTLMGLILGAWR